MLKSKLEEIRITLMELENLKVDIIGISDKNANYFSPVCETSQFFNRVYWNSIKLFIIEMHKLLHYRQHFCLLKAINHAQTHLKDIQWKHEITYAELDNLKLKLESIDQNDLKNLQDLRDKHYAHNDKDKYKLKINLNLSKCWKMLEEIQSIFNTLSYHLENNNWKFELFFTPPNELYKVYRYELIRKMYFEQIVTYPEDGTLIQLRELLRKT